MKTKVAMNLTKRQLVCFGSAAAIGVPTYILTRIPLGDTTAALLMIGLMLPMFFLAMYEKDGQPAEKVIRNIIRTKFFWPGKRPYKTENLYETLEKEAKTIAQDNTEAHRPQAAPTGKGRKG